MRIKNPQSQEELKIYSARLKFTKEKKENGQVKNMVRVTIRYKKRDPKKRDFQIPNKPNPDDPEDLYINTEELHWVRYRGKDIAIYRRTSNGENYDYVIKSRINIPTALRYRLEGLVKKVCFENSDKTEHTK